MPNQTQISKLISYWLRHNPSDANLVADEFGWISTADILTALKLRDQETTLDELISLSQSFDKVRWQFSDDKALIRATHGHSIPVSLSDATPPPPLLYHGTSINKLEAIINTGLLPMQRQFVHLSESITLAQEVGKRHGKAILIEIDTEPMVKAGWLFYKTSENVWLTTAIPTTYFGFSPWEMVSAQERSFCLNELKKEVNQGHALYYRLSDLELILRRYDQDDFLFFDKSDNSVHQVHLTWNNEASTKWPVYSSFDTMNKWAEDTLITDQQDYLLC